MGYKLLLQGFMKVTNEKAVKLSRTRGQRDKKLAHLTAKELENYQERAAILEFDAGYSRDEAEESAYQAIILRRGAGDE